MAEPRQKTAKLTLELLNPFRTYDIDGITGGFNFQAAWTTAYTVVRAIATTIK